MGDRWAGAQRDNPDSFGRTLTDYTPTDADLPNDIKAVFFDADGTCTIKPAGGGTAIPGVPIIKGFPLPFVPGRITAMSGPTHCFLVSG
jgi:hypothetical protein